VTRYLFPGLAYRPTGGVVVAADQLRSGPAEEYSDELLRRLRSNASGNIEFVAKRHSHT